LRDLLYVRQQLRAPHPAPPLDLHAASPPVAT